MKQIKLFLAGTSGITDTEDINRIIFTNQLGYAIALAMLIIAPCICYFYHWKLSVVIPLSIEFCLNYLAILLNRHHKQVSAAIILYFLQCVAIIYFGAILGNLLSLEFTIVLLIAVAYLIFKRASLRMAAVAMAMFDLAILELGYYYKNPYQLNIPLSYNATFFIHVLVVMGLIFLIIVVSKPYVKSNDTYVQLDRANRMIKIFVAQITHELRTPLDNIHHVAQLLKKEVHNAQHLKKIRSLVEIIWTVSSSAGQIVNNVLDMAEIESGRAPTVVNEPINISAFLEKMLEVHRIIAQRERMKVSLSISAEMPEVILGDAMNINQILTNLLSNAVKYGSKRTTINITIEKLGDYWQLKVSNWGPGIAPEKIDSIFKPFGTNKSANIQGSSLGLYIVKAKASSMGGKIEVESDVNGLTTFTVTLPLQEGKIGDLPNEDEPEINAYDLQKINVLVAEDSKLTSYLFSEFLSDMGCSFSMTSNGQELIETAIKKCPDECPDIFIVDGHMPILNGEETIRRLKQTPELSHIPIIVITGDIYSDTINKMQAAGADACLKKPIDYLALQNAIMLHVNKSSQN